MFGIIATIIAAKKGHSTFAWVVGIWSVVEIIMFLAKAPYAVGPGWVFIIIAICMKKVNIAPKEHNEYPKENDIVFTTSSPYTHAAGTETITSGNTSEKEASVCVAPLMCDVEGYMECPICHTRQAIGRPYCFRCNAKLQGEPVPFVRSTEPERATADEHPADEHPIEEETRQVSLDEPKPRFCRKCGSLLLKNRDFCGHCGTKVVSVPQELTAVNSPIDTTVKEEPVPKEHVVRNQEF